MKLVVAFVFSLLLFQSQLTVSAQTGSNPLPDDLYVGLTLFEEGQFEQAILKFNRFMETESTGTQVMKASYYLALSQAAVNPENETYYYDIFIANFPHTREAGNLYIDLAHRESFKGNAEKANYFYERALKRSSDEFQRAELLYWNAETYASRRLYDDAHTYYNTLVSNHPRSEWAPKALFNKGRLFLVQQRYDEASATFEDVRRRYATDPVTRKIGTALGEAYFRQGRYEETITSLRAILGSLDSEQETKAVYMLAESYNYLDQLDDASVWYRRLINIREGQPEERFAHYGLGWVFHKQGIYHWAADSFNRAISGSDDLLRSAMYYKAVNQKLSGRYDLALLTFEEFGNRFETGEWVERAYYEWAILAFQIGDYVTAIDKNLYLIRSGMELEDPAAVFTLLGEAYFANAEYGRSIEAFERAESLGDIDPQVKNQARFQRGWVLFRNQAFEAAQQIFQGVHEETPGSDIGAEALFWSADSYFNMQRFGDAARNFRRFINDYPNHEFAGAARYSLGWSYFNQGQFDQALAPFREFLNNYQAPPVAMFPYDIDTRLRIGDALFAMRRYEDAQNYYEMVLDESRGADYAKYQIASSLYRDDQTFEAVRNFRRLIVDFPESSLREQAQYNIGYIYLLAGNSAQAVQEFETMLRLFPFSSLAPRAQFNIGNAYYNAGQNENAIAAYRRMLERFPRSDLVIEAVNGIQFAQMAMGGDDTSTEILEDFLAENPQAGTADLLRFRQAENLYQSGDFEQAIDSFRQYIRVTNNTRRVPEALFYIANSFVSMNNRTEARNTFNELINNHSNSSRYADALASLATLEMNAGNHSAALSLFTRLETASSDYRTDALIGKGNALLKLNRASEARQAFESVEQRGGREDAVRLGFANIAFTENRFADARNLFRTLADENSNEVGAEAQYMLGRTYQAQRDYNQAIQAYANVRTFFGAYGTWVANSMLGSAESYMALGVRSQAEALVRTLNEEYPNTDAARRARQLLQN